MIVGAYQCMQMNSYIFLFIFLRGVVFYKTNGETILFYCLNCILLTLGLGMCVLP